MRERYDALMNNPAEIEKILRAGAEKARALSQAVHGRTARTPSACATWRAQAGAAGKAKTAKAALPAFKQYREADGQHYFKLVDAGGRLLAQSAGLRLAAGGGPRDSPAQAATGWRRLEAALELAEGVTAAEVSAALELLGTDRDNVGMLKSHERGQNRFRVILTSYDRRNQELQTDERLRHRRPPADARSRRDAAAPPAPGRQRGRARPYRRRRSRRQAARHARPDLPGPEAAGHHRHLGHSRDEEPLSGNAAGGAVRLAGGRRRGAVHRGRRRHLHREVVGRPGDRQRAAGPA